MTNQAKSPKFSPEVRERAVRMVLDHAGDYPSQWAAIASIAAKIGCTAQTLSNWVKQTERDSGKRAGLTRAVLGAVDQACAVVGGDNLEDRIAPLPRHRVSVAEWPSRHRIQPTYR